MFFKDYLFKKKGTQRPLIVFLPCYAAPSGACFAVRRRGGHSGMYLSCVRCAMHFFFSKVSSFFWKIISFCTNYSTNMGYKTSIYLKWLRITPSNGRFTLKLVDFRIGLNLQTYVNSGSGINWRITLAFGLLKCAGVPKTYFCDKRYL